MSTDKSYSGLRTLARVLFRHKTKVVGCFVLLLAATAVLLLLRERGFTSQARLLVQIGRESVTLDPTATMGETVGLRQDRENELRSELEILRSPDLSALDVDEAAAASAIDTVTRWQLDGTLAEASPRETPA